MPGAQPSNAKSATRVVVGIFTKFSRVQPKNAIFPTAPVPQGSVTCDDVQGDIQAGGNVTCDCAEGDIHAGGNVTADEVSGDIRAGGSVYCEHWER